MKKKNSQENTLGQKLTKLRLKQKISIEDLAEKTGLTVKHLKAVEDGKDFLPVGDILKISRVLTIDPELLFQTRKDRELKEKRLKDFKIREESYQYEVLTPKAKESHLRSFKVTIPPRSEHPKVKFQHDGEEFIYVLKGEIEIQVGSRKHILKKDETIHFDSSKKHSLKNPGKQKAVFIDTIYTP